MSTLSSILLWHKMLRIYLEFWKQLVPVATNDFDQWPRSRVKKRSNFFGGGAARSGLRTAEHFPGLPSDLMTCDLDCQCASYTSIISY